MKVVGLMVVGPAEADRYLKASLDELKRLADDAIIVGNNTDAKTEKLIKSYGFWFYRDNREWGKFQPAIKTDLLKRIGNLNPSVVLPFDADEVYDPLFTRTELERVASQYPACYFYIVNLWNDERHHRKTLGFWNIRMFNWRPELGLDYAKKNVHCGLGPPWTYIYGSHVPFIVKHYGLMKPGDRMKKVERYEKYDPRAKFKDRSYYESLKYDGEGAEFNESEFHARLAAEVASYGNQIKTIIMSNSGERFVLVRRLIDGVSLDMKEQEWEEMGSRKKEFEFLHIIGDEPGEDRVIEPPKETGQTVNAIGFECPICGQVCKTKMVLGKHKKIHA